MISMGMVNHQPWGRPKWRKLSDYDTPHKDLTHIVRRTNNYLYTFNPDVQYETHSFSGWHDNREWQNWKVHQIGRIGRGHRMTWSTGQGSFNGKDIPAFLFED